MPKLEKDQYSKAEVEELIREGDDAHAEALEVAKREAEMTDAEKEVYKTLDGDAKNDFLFATAEERAVEVTKRVEDNPVVYTSAAGHDFRKNDDPRLVEMAKERDQERRDFLKMQQEREDERLQKRAEEELPNLPGTVETRAAMLKAVEGIEDEETRTAALDSLKAQNSKMAKAFEEVGSRGVKKSQDANQGGTPAGNAFEELDALAKQYQKDNPGTDYYTAYEAVSQADPDLAKRAVEEG